jgi:hypothetical protein
MAAVGLAILGLGACGSASHEPVVVRVGRMSIDKGMVDHWANAIARGATPVMSVGSLSQSPRQQAIASLISADWLVGEAAVLGLKPPAGQIERQIKETSRSAGGHAESQQLRTAVGETTGDAGLEAQVQWAAAAIEHLLTEEAARRARAAVADRQVGAYYRQHLGQYRHKEVREFDIVEGFKSVGAAQAFVKRHGTGSRFSKIAFHESYERPTRFEGPRGKGRVLQAIFSARVGLVSPPMWLNHGYIVFVLRHIRPPYVVPLGAVRAAIERHLLAGPRRQAIAGLLAAYDRRWTAKTDCSPGYVVPKCRQYRGPRVLEEGSLWTMANAGP